MTQEKKFFVPELHHYDHDLSKRWRIEWYIPSPGGSRRCPKPVYGNINKGKTVEDRLKLAEQEIASLQLDLGSPKPQDALSRVIESNSLFWSAKTISAYRTPANRFVDFLKRTKPEKATAQHVNAFLLSLKAAGSSKGTISKYHNTLFTLYKEGVKQNLFKSNPVDSIPRIKKSPQSYFYFTDRQIALFENAQASGQIPAQLWLAMELLFYCFIRPGEQRHMRIDWINFEYQYIEIPGEYSKNGKTQKVSIPDALLPSLLFLQEYPGNFYVLSKSLQPGTVQISTKHLNDEHRKVLKALKITGRYAFYSWKHTGVVKAVRAGINIKDLQLQLRHHSLDMVDEYLKQLGVTDSEDLRSKFPRMGVQVTMLKHKRGCTCTTKPEYNYCPDCGVKLKAAA